MKFVVQLSRYSLEGEWEFDDIEQAIAKAKELYLANSELGKRSKSSANVEVVLFACLERWSDQ